MLKKLIFSSVLLSANLISIAASATQTETAYTTYSRYDERGVLLMGTISAKTESGYLATRNTYDDSGKLTNVEKGSLRDWQGEGVLPSAWSGFSPISSQSFDYDAYARKVKETTYDNAGKAISLVQMNYDPDGHIQCKAVRMNPDVYNSLPDACTLSAEGVNGPDRISTFTYNYYDKVTSEKRTLNVGKVQNYVTNEYDGSYLHYQTDANNNRTELRYDSNARLERVVYPSITLSANAVNESDYVQFTYDDNGNKLTERKRSGETISYQYDANNRMTVKDYANNTSIKDVCYVYDNRGLQLEAHFGNSTSPSVCVTGVGLSNTYYGVGTINTATTNQSGTAQTITYTYDLNGNRDTIKHPDNVLFKYAFDGINRVTGVANEAGAENSLLAVHYGVSGKRSSINRNGSAGATTEFKFDNGVQLNQFTQTLGTPADNFSNTFKYNAANQVIWLKESNTSYSYVGNDDRAGDYTPDGLNRYARAPVPSMGTPPFGYDGNSNLTNDGNTIYSYDAENHLVAASKAGKIVKFEYDPNGRLYQYTSGDGVNHKYLYDNNSLVLEYVNGVVDKRYVHGDQADEPWAMYTGASVGTANLSYLHTNHQGSIVAYTNASGQVTNKLAYDAYGIPASLNMGTFGYTGQVYLKDLGLYYYKARIYHPQLGRFLQTDPIGYKDDMDLYSYVGNDPVNKTDPTGTYGRGDGFTDDQWKKFNKLQQKAAAAMEKRAGKLEAKADKLDAKGKSGGDNLRASASNLRGGAASLRSDGSDGKVANAVDGETYRSMGGSQDGGAFVPRSDRNLVYINTDNKAAWSGSMALWAIGHESLHSTGVELTDQRGSNGEKAYKYGNDAQKASFKELRGTDQGVINPDNLMDLVY